MNRLAPLVAHGQPAELAEPGQRPLDSPPEPPEPLARLDAFARDPTRNSAAAQIRRAALGVIGFVRVQLRRAASGATQRALDRLDGFDHYLEQRALIDVRPRQPDGERDTLAVDHHMPFRAGFAAIRRIRAGRFAAPFARTVTLSTLARDQSIPSRSPRRCSRVWCRRCHTPA